MVQPTFLQKLRKEKGLSQRFVAEKIGVSRPTYIDIEKGVTELTVSQAKELAKILEISLEDLIAEKKKPFINVVLEKDAEKEEQKKELRIDVPQKNVKKFKEVFLYILEKVGGKPSVGMTVIYKLLYFIDFDFYEKFEEQLIGARYIKNHYGPTPIEFKKVVEDMEKRGELEVVKSKYFQHDQTKYLPRRQADISLLNALEIKHVDEVLQRLSDKSATELSEYSHKDIPWITAKEGTIIPYESVFYRTKDTSVREYADDQL